MSGLRHLLGRLGRLVAAALVAAGLGACTAAGGLYYFPDYFTNLWQAAATDTRNRTARVSAVLDAAAGCTETVTFTQFDPDIYLGSDGVPPRDDITMSAPELSAYVTNMGNELFRDVDHAVNQWSPGLIEVTEATRLVIQESRAAYAIDAAARLAAACGLRHEGRILSAAEWRDTFWDFSSP